MAARRPRVLTLSAKESVILQLLVRHAQAYGLELVSASRGRLKRGTVYVTLGRMEEKGYITSRLEDAPPEAGGLPRRIYTPNRARAAGAGGLVAAHEVSDPGGDAMSAPNGRLRQFPLSPLLRSHHGAAGRSDSDGYRDRGESCSVPRATMDRPLDTRCGRFALVKALALFGWTRFWSIREWPVEERRAVARSMAYAFVVTCAGVKLLMLPPLLQLPPEPLSGARALPRSSSLSDRPACRSPSWPALRLSFVRRVAAVANPGHGRGDRLLCLVPRRRGVGRAGFEPGLPGRGVAGFPDSQGTE